MLVDVVVLQVLTQHPLGEIAAVQVGRLFGDGQLVQNFRCGHHPADAQARGADFGKRAHQHRIVRGVMEMCFGGVIELVRVPGHMARDSIGG